MNDFGINIPPAAVERMLIHLVGGPAIWEALARYWVRGETIRSIARNVGIDHMTLGRRMAEGKAELQAVGVWPANMKTPRQRRN